VGVYYTYLVYYIYLVLHVLISTSFYFDWLYSLFLSWYCLVAEPRVYKYVRKVVFLLLFFEFHSFEIRRTKKKKKPDFSLLIRYKLWFRFFDFLTMTRNEKWISEMLLWYLGCVSHITSCVWRRWLKNVYLFDLCVRNDFVSDIFWMNKMEFMMIPKL